MDIMSETRELIEKIPYEMRDCFYISLNKKDAYKLINEVRKCLTYRFDVHFPCEIDGVKAIINECDWRTEIKIVENKEKILKLYRYEKHNVEKYFERLSALNRKYKYYITGCGCCGSPFLMNLYTMTIDNIGWDGTKIIYDMEIMSEYKDFFSREMISK